MKVHGISQQILKYQHADHLSKVFEVDFSTIKPHLENIKKGQQFADLCAHVSFEAKPSKLVGHEYWHIIQQKLPNRQE